MEIEKTAEYIGYGKLANILLKASKPLRSLSKKIKRQADLLYFEQYKMKFGQRDSDIYIVSYPKSGTTLTQMILYQLTTDGSMDFDHIYDVSPWIRNASFMKQDVHDLPSPRIIKSHDLIKGFDKDMKGRILHVYRNGMDVAVSLYHQNLNYNNPNLDFDKFIQEFTEQEGWAKFNKVWFQNKKKLPVLHIKYEDLLADKKREIERIIRFCDLKPSNIQLQRALEMSEFEEMKKYEEKFGDKAPEKKKVYDQFIRNGKIGEGKAKLNEEQQKRFTASYNKHLSSLLK